MKKKKDSGKFLYDDVKQAILKDYADSPYYTAMPSERELCETYHVSRPTIRKALEMLNEEGIISTLRGKGTFYIGPKKFTSERLTIGHSGISFYDQVVSQGGNPYSKVLVQDVRLADKRIAANLNIDVDEEVFVLKRVRYIDDELYQINTSRIPYKLCPQLTDVDFSGYVSLHETLRSFGIYPYYAKKMVEVSRADKREAMHLNLKEGDPILVSQIQTFDKDNRILEYATTKSTVYNTRFEMTIYNNEQETEE
ncbi:MAG: GntR family transcriptional regulator [Erysipelotrichaceae bacterium]|jgi:GntR family transcriptional regulator|nr:GntR family transcriptional regulator [Erysipelotrichaceae bacterium]